MTPEQMKELAARLRAPSLRDREEAADLIRQMAEQEPVAYGMFRKDGLLYDILTLSEYEEAPKADRVVPLYAEPPAPPDDTALLRQALDALEYHMQQTRPIDKTSDAITAIRARLDGAPQPARSLSRRLAAAGFTRRDTRIECDECGKKVTPQFLPIHECAPQPARVPLTWAEMQELVASKCGRPMSLSDPALIRAVERHHNIRSEE